MSQIHVFRRLVTYICITKISHLSILFRIISELSRVASIHWWIILLQRYETNLIFKIINFTSEKISHLTLKMTHFKTTLTFIQRIVTDPILRIISFQWVSLLLCTCLFYLRKVPIVHGTTCTNHRCLLFTAL